MTQVDAWFDDVCMICDMYWTIGLCDLRWCLK